MTAPSDRVSVLTNRKVVSVRGTKTGPWRTNNTPCAAADPNVSGVVGVDRKRFVNVVSGARHSKGYEFHAAHTNSEPTLPTSAASHWSGRPDSNRRPSPWQGDALPLSHFRSRRRDPEGPASPRSAEGQNRTGDTSVFSAVLYRLSYLGA